MVHLPDPKQDPEIIILLLEKRRSHGNELQMENIVLEESFCCVMEMCSKGKSSRGLMSSLQKYSCQHFHTLKIAVFHSQSLCLFFLSKLALHRASCSAACSSVLNCVMLRSRPRLSSIAMLPNFVLQCWTSGAWITT